MKKNKGIFIIITLSILLLVVLSFLLSSTPLLTLKAIFIGPFSSKYFLGNTLNSMVPLIFAALGILVAMRCGLMNLGGEGQIYIGALVSTVVALKFSHLGYFSLVFAVIAGFLVSGIIALFSGYFKVKFNTNEMITSYLLSVAIIHLTDYLITNPFKDPNTNLLSTHKISISLKNILPPSQLSTALLYALITVVIIYLILNHTRLGYENKIVGKNRAFARYGGISITKTYLLAMILSGGLHGMAGSFAVIGTYQATIKSFSSGMGWNALIISLIALNNEIAIIFVALFFAWINQGTIIAMQTTDITSDIALIVQATLFFLATSSLLLGDEK